MEPNQNQKDKKDKYNLDDDTSSYSPEIEEESNNGDDLDEAKNKPNQILNYDEQEKNQNNPNMNVNKSSILYDKLVTIQKKMDSNQEKQRYLQYNQNNNNDNNNYKKNYFPKKKLIKRM